MTKFIKIDNRIIPTPKGSEYELENGKVYDLLIYTSWGETSNKFTINGELNTPKKIYTTKKDEIFIKRVLHNFNNDSSNTTGVLLTGEKGCGKTMAAKILAERANLPIIVINPRTELDKISDFFKQFDTPVCILFDEVDKEFNTSKLLTFLDGLQKTSKKLVIMTANNEDSISSYLKNRCSRMRYYRHYTMVEDAKEYTELICEDFDIKGEEKTKLVDFIANKIEYPSIDNILSFIKEYLFTRELDITLEEVLEFMNINVSESSSNCYEDESDDEVCN